MMAVLQYVADLLFPRLCPVCGRALSVGERHVCTLCMAELPRTGYHTIDFNPMEQLFAGKVPVERATGYFFYERGSRHAAILHAIKYHNQPQMGEWMGRQFAGEVAQSGFFGDVDAVVPVPMHRGKLARRGYNQSEYIARGISSVIGCPVEKVVKAVKGHDTQTHKGRHERLVNMQGVFALASAEAITGRHLLLVDDVVTTGATLLSCAEVLRQAAPDVRISIATLAVSRLQ